MMRIFFATFWIILFCSNSFAQQSYFICIQSDNNQPFYTRIAQKTYGSTAAGNLVIAGLKDSSYRVAIGFPRNKYPEQYFTIIFNQKDLGFQLKYNESQGWALVNWQTQEVLNPRSDLLPGDALLYGERKKDEGFASLMAAVVNDSAVLYNTLVRTAPPKQETSTGVATVESVPAPVIPTDSAIGAGVIAGNSHAIDTAVLRADTMLASKPAVVGIDSAMAIKKDTMLSRQEADSAVAVVPIPKQEPKPDAMKPGVLMLESSDIAEGKKMVFKDLDAIDTISIIIPFEKDSSPVASLKPAVVADSPATSTRVDTGTHTTAPPVAMKDTASQQGGTTEESKKKLVLLNSDCANFATDYDVDKLRIKILAETNLEGRLAAAKKVFRTKCFTTRQIRALSELFLGDEERFRFFELGYPYSADTSNYKQLVELLTDANYISRFKAMVRMQD